jgi:hypothetical protein
VAETLEEKPVVPKVLSVVAREYHDCRLVQSGIQECRQHASHCVVDARDRSTSERPRFERLLQTDTMRHDVVGHRIAALVRSD